MTDQPRVPPDVVARVGAICLGLPEVVEEAAWAGVRWVVAGKNFAHVVRIEHGRPAAYAQAAGTPGPATVLTLRLPPARLDLPRFARAPFFRPVWFPNIVGLAVDATTDWDDVAELVTDSYATLAPKRLVARLDR
ncbi:MAG TPA: MmcQ/YjbR family DNA-binding protein [Tahibacter sp.]|nr:MmcQ/YjbR family DNA-binding protein [Tahibacter sp.]